MKLRQVLWIYNLLLPVALLLGLPGYLIKAIRRGGARDNFSQRFGRYDGALLELWRQDQEAARIWIHAVSVGEVLVGMKVIHALLEENAQQQIVLSTTTPTGYRLAKAECPAAVQVIYNPVDLPWVVCGALDRIRPQKIILIEAELWPNLAYQAKRRGVQLSLVNARLSERSERRFRKFTTLTGPIFGMLDVVCVQFERDVERWMGLGIEREKIHLVGSIKYDEQEEQAPSGQMAELRELLQALGIGSDQPVLLAGSTHAGEEALIGRVYQQLQKQFPDLLYIVVPRHVERAAEVVRDLEAIGLSVSLRSNCDSEQEELSEGNCLLVDTTGELRAWYHLASLVVVGKSFLGKGGQNPVEPIMAGKPVIVGPNMGNFTAVMQQLLQQRGLVQVEGAEDLLAAAKDVLSDQEEAALMAKRALVALDQHRGAARRTVKVLGG
ncbi:MAG: 3-deoxy-D-manno-octulosonic acid transferase [Verrucomicrobiales bacterium]|nr:3-deoxy-D-manno-octulosonic acid transferase [Verrucomicrobiales bacterium]